MRGECESRGTGVQPSCRRALKLSRHTSPDAEGARVYFPAKGLGTNEISARRGYGSVRRGGEGPEIVGREEVAGPLENETRSSLFLSHRHALLRTRPLCLVSVSSPVSLSLKTRGRRRVARVRVVLLKGGAQAANERGSPTRPFRLGLGSRSLQNRTLFSWEIFFTRQLTTNPRYLLGRGVLSRNTKIPQTTTSLFHSQLNDTISGLPSFATSINGPLQ